MILSGPQKNTKNTKKRDLLNAADNMRTSRASLPLLFCVSWAFLWPLIFAPPDGNGTGCKVVGWKPPLRGDELGRHQVWNHAGRIPARKERGYRFAAARSEVESPVVHVHPHKLVCLPLIEITPVL